MLQPKRTKYRRSQKGRMRGNAQRGHELAFGSYGIKALENMWIEQRQIEAARVAVTRYMQRQGQIWIRIFPDKPIDAYKRQDKWHREIYILQETSVSWLTLMPVKRQQLSVSCISPE